MAPTPKSVKWELNFVFSWKKLFSWDGMQVLNWKYCKKIRGRTIYIQSGLISLSVNLPTRKPCFTFSWTLNTTSDRSDEERARRERRDITVNIIIILSITILHPMERKVLKVRCVMCVYFCWRNGEEEQSTSGGELSTSGGELSTDYKT